MQRTRCNLAGLQQLSVDFDGRGVPSLLRIVLPLMICDWIIATIVPSVHMRVPSPVGPVRLSGVCLGVHACIRVMYGNVRVIEALHYAVVCTSP